MRRPAHKALLLLPSLNRCSPAAPASPARPPRRQVLSTLRDNGLSIVSTGGETADLGDLVRTVVVDSTVVARMRRADVISNDRIAVGDVIVGIASDGQARAAQRTARCKT